MNLSTIRSRVRSFINEPTASYWSDSEINGWINDGIEELEIDSLTTDDVRTTSSVAYQQEYDLDSDVLKVVDPVHWEDDPLNWMDWEDYIRFVGAQNLSEAGNPTDCMVYKSKLYLHPRPADSASQATTSATMSSSVASMIVDSTDGFPESGRFIIGSEVVAYTNTTDTKFAGLTRAMENTTATGHNIDSVATERDITYPCKIMATLTSDSDSPSFKGLHKGLAYYAAREAWSKKGEIERIKYFDDRWQKSKVDIKKFTLRQLFGRPHVKDDDLYGKRRF